MTNLGEIIDYQATLWLAESYVVRMAGVKSAYLRVAKSRAKKNHDASWQHESLSGCTYFRYESLPERTAMMLAPLATLQQNAIRHSNEITTLVDTARLRAPQFVGQVDEPLTDAASIIHHARLHVSNFNISFKKSAFFKALGNEIAQQQVKHLPKEWRNIRDKVKAYNEGTPLNELLKVKGKGNDNRAVYTRNNLLLAWLIELGCSQKNYTYEHIQRKLALMCEQHGLKSAPAIRWVGDFLNTPNTQFLIQKRFGEKSRFNQKHRGYTPTQSAIYAGDCWDIDGTRVNIVDHRANKKAATAEGNKVAQRFLYIVAVRDVMSGQPMGWSFGYSEDHTMVIDAVAMAVRNAEYLPYEMRYDRFPGHQKDEWRRVESELRKAGVEMTQTVNADGKAGIERWWGTLQTVFMSESDYYYGEGIRSTRRYAHRSKEYMLKLRQESQRIGFNFDMAVEETERIIDAYMNTPYSAYSRKFKKIEKSPYELHAESDKPNTIHLEQAHYCQLFGLRKEVSIRNYMIQTQINGATYYYAIDDVRLIEQYTGKKLLNCFDYEDLDSVHLFDGNNYLGMFNRIEPAQQYGPEKDMRAVGKMKAIDTKVKAHRAKKQQEYADVLNSLETQEDMEQAISSEMEIMLAGRVPKGEYEEAESGMLQEAWTNENNIEISVRRDY